MRLAAIRHEPHVDGDSGMQHADDGASASKHFVVEMRGEYESAHCIPFKGEIPGSRHKGAKEEFPNCRSDVCHSRAQEVVDKLL